MLGTPIWLNTRVPGPRLKNPSAIPGKVILYQCVLFLALVLLQRLYHSTFKSYPHLNGNSKLKLKEKNRSSDKVSIEVTMKMNNINSFKQKVDGHFIGKQSQCQRQAL